MQNILKQIQSYQLDAVKYGVSLSTECFFGNDDEQFIKAQIRYANATGDISEKRYFETTFSSEDLPSITEKKLICVKETLNQIKTIQNTIDDIVITEE